MLLVIGIILFILWLLGLFTSRMMGGLVHIALVVALILIIIWLLKAVFKVF
ncbi:MAG: lmo0937 family membrane protein [Dehalococcoidales bacterium]